jgi:hypothetical protein
MYLSPFPPSHWLPLSFVFFFFFFNRYDLQDEERCQNKKEKQEEKDGYLVGPNHWVWVSKPEDKEECLQYKQCKQRLVNRRGFLMTRYNEKDESDCELVGGKYGSVFDWKKGRWMKAKMMVSSLPFFFLLLLVLVLIRSYSLSHVLATEMDEKEVRKSF